MLWSQALRDRVLALQAYHARLHAICSPTTATSRYVLRQWQHAASYATSSLKDKDNDKTFQGQLYDSTQQRVLREKADQARFAQIRESRKAASGSGAWVTPFVLAIGTLLGWQVGSQSREKPSLASTTPLSAASTPPKHNTAPTNLQAAWTDFRDVVGADNISTDAADLAAHSGSEWSTHPTLAAEQPFCILKPITTDQVSRIMKVCHQRRIPVTAYSGGTSLEGHFAATRGGVCIDFSRMDQIIELHQDDLDVVVQPAVGWEELNEQLSAKGLFFPPDPGPGAKIGGMVGTGCSGTNAYRYGTMKDWVLSLTVVLADGTVIKTRQRPRKSSAGYDLTRTFIGSEGTLGLVTEATLKLAVSPQHTSVAVSTFPTIRSAADAVASLVRAGIPVAAMELLDDVQMRLMNESRTTTRTWLETPTLFLKFAGTPLAVREQISQVKTLVRAQTFESARNADEARALWSARKQALWSVVARKQSPAYHVWTTDVAVPISRLADIIDETKESVRRTGLTASIVGHMGDGNFHTILLFNDSQREQAKGLVHNMVKRAIELGGTSSGEHGVGLVKRDYLDHELGVSTVALMRRMKQAFDPLCLLNCNKVIRMQQPEKGDVLDW